MAVRIGDMSEYCHVGVAVWLGDTLFVAESVMPSVRLMPLSNMSHKGFYWIPLAEMGSDEFKFVMSKIGRGKYSKWQGILAKLKKLVIGDDDLWQCAEFAIASRNLSGVDLGYVATPSQVVAVGLGYGPLYRVTA